MKEYKIIIREVRYAEARIYAHNKEEAESKASDLYEQCHPDYDLSDDMYIRDWTITAEEID